jgi:hypothetical protein
MVKKRKNKYALLPPCSLAIVYPGASPLSGTAFGADACLRCCCEKCRRLIASCRDGDDGMTIRAWKLPSQKHDANMTTAAATRRAAATPSPSAAATARDAPPRIRRSSASPSATWSSLLPSVRRSAPILEHSLSLRSMELGIR